MDTVVIKSQLQKMIDQQDDISVLEAIYTLLQKTSLNPVLKYKLTERAKISEADITAGRLLTKQEVIERTNSIIK